MCFRIELYYYLPYNSIDDVIIQYDIPLKKIEVSIAIPEYYYYNVKQKGYISYDISNESKNKKINISSKSVSGGPVRKTAFSTSSIDYKVNITYINESNIPALKKEPYVNNMDNYRGIASYDLASIKWPNETIKYYSQTWKDIAKNIFKSDKFGGELKKNSHLKGDILILKSENSTLSEKVGNALQFVKSKIKWNGTYGEYPEKGLRKAFKEGSGNIGDINLTLVAVLRELGLDANPVLLSTRNNGVPLFPTAKGINYVIAHVKTSDGYILLDASEKYSLPLRTMNWQGVIIKKEGSVGYVSLENSATAKEDSILNYKISEDGFIEGMNRVKYENLYSIDYRNKKAILTEDDLISNIEESNDDIEIINFRLSNKDNIAKPIVEMYSFEREDGAEIIGDKMYLKPLLFIAMDENPFKIDSREYPVDFGTPWRESINVIIEIPEGFKIESLPENMGTGLRDETGKFIFSVKELGNKIQISSLLEINRAVISADYYTDLKEFFKQVVAKQTEQIILSRI